MHVVCDPLRGDLQHVDQVLGCPLERQAGSRVVEVANVRRKEGLVAAREAERRLVPAAAGEHRRSAGGQADRLRREPTGAADERGAAIVQANDAVIATPEDLAVVKQQCVGNAGKAGDSFLIPVTSGSPPGLALVSTSTSACACSSQAVPEGRPAAS